MTLLKPELSIFICVLIEEKHRRADILWESELYYELGRYVFSYDQYNIVFCEKITYEKISVQSYDSTP